MNLAGNLASVLGLLVAVVGFIVTVRVARNAQSAAERAQAAAIGAQRKLLRLDTISEISAAISVMEEARRLHRLPPALQVWPIALDRYAEARRHLTRVHSGGGELNDVQRSVLQGAIRNLRGIEGHVERDHAQGTPPRNLLTLNRIISRHIDEMNRLLLEVRNFDVEAEDENLEGPAEVIT